MEGDDRVRFCGRCRKNVYNLSEMTEAEAQRLLVDKEGRLCARLYRRRDGTVLTKDCPVPRPWRRLRWAGWGALAASLLSIPISGLGLIGLSSSEEITGALVDHITPGPPELTDSVTDQPVEGIEVGLAPRRAALHSAPARHRRK